MDGELLLRRSSPGFSGEQERQLGLLDPIDAV